MKCNDCEENSRFHCECSNCPLCEQCVIKHIIATEKNHVVRDVLQPNRIDLQRCEVCKKNLAKVFCSCQSEKNVFCAECIRGHLDGNSSHCVESIENYALIGEVFKYQEKRKKIEYLLYEVRKSVEAVRAFKNEVRSGKEILLKELENCREKGKLQAGKSKGFLNELFDDLTMKIIPSMKEPSMADVLINKTDPQFLDRMDKYMNLAEVKIQSENVVRTIKSTTKFELLIDKST